MHTKFLIKNVLLGVHVFYPPSEGMTIIILFHSTGFRNFKTFYKQYVLRYLFKDFRVLPSDNRFIEIKKEIVFPLYFFLAKHFGQTPSIGFIDSISLSKSARAPTIKKHILKPLL